MGRWIEKPYSPPNIRQVIKPKSTKEVHMPKNFSAIRSDKEKAGQYVSEMLAISVKTDGMDFLLRIGGEIYRIDVHKCNSKETLLDSAKVLRSLTDAQHQRLYDVQNKVHEMGNELVHLLDEIQTAVSVSE